MRIGKASVLAILVACAASCSSTNESPTSPDEGVAGDMGYAGVPTEPKGSSGASSELGGSSGTGGSPSIAGSGGKAGAVATGGHAETDGAVADGSSRDMGVDTGPPPEVTPCAIHATGSWENVTPADVPIGGMAGSIGWAIDPVNPAVLYLGTVKQGIYRSSDCGATWVKANTGKNGQLLDQGSNWSVQVDRDEMHTVYANSGYGPMGLFKSTNGGVDWEQILDSHGAGANFVYGGFVHLESVDPSQASHLIVTPHFDCQGGNTASCILESKDSGRTWKVLENAPLCPDGTTGCLEQGTISMVDASIWLWAGWGGLWRTANAGATWAHVLDIGSVAAALFATGPDGAIYIGANNGGGIFASADHGATWTKIKNSPVPGIPNAPAATSTQLYVQVGMNDIWVAPFSDVTKWTKLNASGGPTFSNWLGGLRYDGVHHLLYVENMSGGIWRYLVQ
jgi:hypothetical protein